MNPSRKTLGRGLDHLMSEASKVETPLAIASNRGLLQLPLESLSCIGTESAPAGPPEDLTNSIRTHGILQPILVRKSEAGYEVIDGHQRLQAAQALGLRTIPAMILNAVPAETALLAAAANRHRVPAAATPVPQLPPMPCPAPIVTLTPPPRGWLADWRLPASLATVAGVALVTGCVATLWFTRASAATVSSHDLAMARESPDGPTVSAGLLDGMAPANNADVTTAVKLSAEHTSPRAGVAPAWTETLRIDGVTVVSTNGIATVIFTAPVFARYITMTPPSEKVMKTLADVLGRIETPVRVRVLGHTDDTPVRASELYRDNYALGLARATRVVQFLRYSAGLASVPLSAASEGDTNPPFANDSPNERARNRTVTLEIAAE